MRSVNLASHARLRIDGNIAVHHMINFSQIASPRPVPESYAVRRFHTEEGIEQANHLFAGIPTPGIPHANAEIIPITAHMQRDAANIGKRNGVAQQVYDLLPNASGRRSAIPRHVEAQ